MTPGCYDNTFTGNLNAFIAKFSADLSTLQAATYLGGGQEQWPHMAIDPSGNIVITGEAYSGAFPVTPGAFQSTFYTYSGYGSELFVSKLSSDLSTLQASTLLGGMPQPYGYGYDYRPQVAIDNQGRIYIACFSEGVGFPTTPGAFNESGEGGYHIVRMDSGLTTVQRGTYLGGSDIEHATGIAVGSDGSVYVVGQTSSTDFPMTASSYDNTRRTTDAVFGARLDNNLATLLGATYLPGAATYGNDPRAKVTLDPSGNLFVSWITSSTALATTPGAFQPSFRNIPYTFDGAIAKFDANFTGNAPVTAEPVIPGNNGCLSVTGRGGGDFKSFAATLALFIPAFYLLRRKSRFQSDSRHSTTGKEDAAGG